MVRLHRGDHGIDSAALQRMHGGGPGPVNMVHSSPATRAGPVNFVSSLPDRKLIVTRCRSRSNCAEQPSGVSTAMSQRKYNSIQLMFNAENKPYLYGAIHIVDGDIDNQWWEPTRPNPGPSRDASASAGPSLQQDSLVGAWPWVESRRKDTTVRAPSGQSQRNPRR